MPTARKLLAGLALALTAISCSDNQSPTNPTAPGDQATGAPTAPVVGKAVLSGTLATPQTFNADGTGSLALGTPVTIGKVQITKFYYEGGQLKVDGGFFAPDGTFIEAFSKAPATLTKGGGTTQPTCPILELDIGQIHLDLLGLVVDLAPVHLDIVAQSGAGNLLGNLLCALVNLLNGAGATGLGAALTNLLNQINALLAGLLASL
jgi:hypothetical protein